MKFNKIYPYNRHNCQKKVAPGQRSYLSKFVIIFVLLALNIFVSASLLYSKVSDEERYIGIDDVECGRLLYRTDRPGEYVPAPLLRTDVKIIVTGMIARAEVSQKFTNSSDKWVEGIYVFPLPENSAVDYMKMIIGERVIEGQIKERQEAKRIYKKAKKEGKKAALIEQERPNIFTNSVANIGPGETVKIVIQYQEDLRYDRGSFSLRFPLVVGPRYIPGKSEIKGFSGSGWAKNTDRVPDAERITPPVLHPDKGKINPVSIHVILDAGFPLQELKSPYHEINYKTEGTEYTISLKGGEIPADRDFVLEWTPKIGYAPDAALFTEELKGEKYILLMLMPPAPDNQKINRIPKETIFIVDTSGSMDGTSIRQAKRALVLAVEKLHSADSFNIIEFNNNYKKLFPHSRSVTDSSRETALSYVRNLRASGGTNMLPALKAALKNQPETEKVRQVIFITDGLVGNESALFTCIKQNLAKSRLFTVGIGSAPNSYFMSKAAEFGRGTYTHIGRVTEVEEKMKKLFSKLESPVLTDINVNWHESNIEAYPDRIQDLYLGEPIVVSAKMNSLPGDNLEVTGNRGKTPWKVNLNLQGGSLETGIHKLWARRKIENLMDKYRTGPGNKSEYREMIVDVALKHHMVSKFTSLVAVEITKSRPETEDSHIGAVPTNLPKGQVYDSIFGKQLPQTATPGKLYILLGLMMLAVAMIIRKLISS